MSKTSCLSTFTRFLQRHFENNGISAFIHRLVLIHFISNKKRFFLDMVEFFLKRFENVGIYKNSVTPISMILLNSGAFGGHTTAIEPWETRYVQNLHKVYSHEDSPSTVLSNVNVLHLSRLRESREDLSTDSPADMPSATASGTHIPSNEECGIRDVWAHNLEEEFRTIRQVVQKYNYVAMDTEFPGVVARPIGEFRSTADYQYQMLRCNVDLLRIIQLGLTFLDESGKTPGGSYTTWQFNFKFNLSEDMYAQDSIDLLQNSGIQFKKHEEEGIDPLEFAELLMTSGIVLMDNIKWLSFHSGYDFGYLLKLLTDRDLPTDESEFFELLKLYFPTIYDVKYLMKSCKNLKGGLQEVAEQLDLERIGPQHQAGSDSLLTGMAFFKMREMFFEDNIDDSKYSGHLYGLGTSFIMNGNSFHDNGDTSSSS